MEEKQEDWPVAKESTAEVWTSEVSLEPVTGEVPEIAMENVEVEVRLCDRAFTQLFIAWVVSMFCVKVILCDSLQLERGHFVLKQLWWLHGLRLAEPPR